MTRSPPEIRSLFMNRSFADDVLCVHAEDGFLGKPQLEFCVNESVHFGVLALGPGLAGD